MIDSRAFYQSAGARAGAALRGPGPGGSSAACCGHAGAVTVVRFLFVFPYRADLVMFRRPWLTLLLSLACALVTLWQWHGDRGAERAAEAFCANPGSPLYERMIEQSFGQSDPATCLRVMAGIRAAEDPHRIISEGIVGAHRLSGQPGPQSRQLLVQAVLDRYQAYEAVVPLPVSPRLWYDPQRWQPLRMLSATFAHASWHHLAGNLFFFFAFAAALEGILGAWRFIAVFVALAVGSFTAGHLVGLGGDPAPPTLGLSGVVYGMMTLFVFFLPTGGIRCLLWLVVVLHRFSVPAWLLVGWYVSIDALQFAFVEERSEVNLVAHLGGAVLGYVLGALFLRTRRERLRQGLAAGEWRPSAAAG